MNGIELQDWSMKIETSNPNGPIATWVNRNFQNKAGDDSEKRAKRSADREIKSLMGILAEQCAGCVETTGWERSGWEHGFLSKRVRIRDPFRTDHYIVTLTPYHRPGKPHGGFRLGYDPDEVFDFKPIR